MYNYKLRFYDKNGNTDHEEFFKDLKSLICRYEQYKTSHHIKRIADCPTAWKLSALLADSGEHYWDWERLMGF